MLPVSEELFSRLKCYGSSTVHIPEVTGAVEITNRDV
jgi:hypothetical protein